MSTGKSFKKTRNDEFNRRVKECTDALEKQYHDVFEEGNKKCAALEEELEARNFTIRSLAEHIHKTSAADQDNYNSKLEKQQQAHEADKKTFEINFERQRTFHLETLDKLMNRNLWQRLINRSV